MRDVPAEGAFACVGCQARVDGGFFHHPIELRERQAGTIINAVAGNLKVGGSVDADIVRQVAARNRIGLRR